MKKFLLSFLIVSSSSLAFAQFGHIAHRHLKHLRDSTIHVVLPDTGGAALKLAVEQNWTFTKYKFISESDLHANYKHKTKMLLLGNFTGTVEEERWILKKIPFVGIVDRFRAKKTHKYKYKRDFEVYMPFSYKKLEDKYLPGYMTMHIHLLNKYIEAIHEPDNHIFNQHSYEHALHGRNYLCREKKILIATDDWHSDEEHINKFDLDHEIVSRDRLQEAILNKEDVLVYYMIVSSNNTFHFLINPKDGDVYFHDFGEVGHHFFKEMQRHMFHHIARVAKHHDHADLRKKHHALHKQEKEEKKMHEKEERQKK